MFSLLAVRRRPALAASAAGATATAPGELIEPALFCAFIAGLAWAPFWYGGNDLLAWGINAVLFPGLAILYEVQLLARGQPHPVAIGRLALPALLFALTAAWIAIQTLPGAGPLLAHPIWPLAADALGTPVPASISPDRDLTSLALVRLLTAAAAFWLALQLCRRGERAEWLVRSIAAIAAGYAIGGLAALAVRSRYPMPPGSAATLSSTFVNHNSFATYAGIGLVAAAGIAAQIYREEAVGRGRVRLANLIETLGGRAALPVGCGFVILVALLLTGSRGGSIAALLGLVGMAFLNRRSAAPCSAAAVEWMVLTIAGAGALIAFGAALWQSFGERGILDASRLAVARLTLRSILDRPLFGHGYGSFADIFPMYRDHSISLVGAWSRAHDTYLEVFQGLGIPFGGMLVAAVVLLALRCARGARSRQRQAIVPAVAAAAAILVGSHAVVDFSLQMQAVALTFAALLGAGVAQSASSRAALEDS